MMRHVLGTLGTTAVFMGVMALAFTLVYYLVHGELPSW